MTVFTVTVYMQNYTLTSKQSNNQTIKIMEEKYFYEELQETLEKLHTKVENGIVLTFDDEDDSIWDW